MTDYDSDPDLASRGRMFADSRHRAVLLHSASSYLGIVCTLVSGVAAARTLGAGGRGIYAGSTTATLFLTVAVGLGVCVSFRRTASLNPRAVPHLAAAAQRFGIRASLATFPLAAAIVNLLFGRLLSPGEQLAAVTTIGLSGLSTIGASYQQLLIAQERLRSLALLRLVPQASVAAAILGLAATGGISLSRLLLATCIKPILEIVVGRRLIPTGGVTREPLRAHFSFGLRSLPNQLAELGTTRVDQLILLPILGPEALGRKAE